MPEQSGFILKDTPELRKKFRRVIEIYKANFAKIDAGERYKWRAIHQFQSCWNMDAPNFAEMLHQAFSKAKNLLANGQYYPLGMLKDRAAKEPEALRELFRMLLDEQIPFQQRFDRFRSDFKAYAASVKVNNTYQDLRAVMVYLTFAYPEKYYLYKHNMHFNFCERLGIPENVPSVFAPEEERLSAFNHLCELLRSEILKDPELTQMSRARLGSDCYGDDAFHLLTMDVIFYGSWAPEVKRAFLAESEAGSAAEGGEDAGAHPALSTDVPLNAILYGPPGTGKTYALPVYALSILEDIPLSDVEGWEREEVLARYREYCRQGRVDFTTFHQSYGYEEFIEGIRPVLAGEEIAEEDTALSYRLEPGVFKRFCERAALANSVPAAAGDLGLSADPKVWKVSLQGAGENPTRSECLQNGHIRIGWDDYGEDLSDETKFAGGGKMPLTAFYNRMRVGDLVLSLYSNHEIDAIGVVTGEPEWHDEYREFKRLRKVRWLDRRVLDIVQLNGGKTLAQCTVYQLYISPADVLGLLPPRAAGRPSDSAGRKNYVFIIDEINRGNISKIFGELITLIEPSKRAGARDAASAVLPYSQSRFEVPGNVYLLGTMNTADRSIAPIDTALRRRFRFRELPPRPELLEGIEVEGLSVARMLERMNLRIAALYDREHAIGHSYLLPLRESPDMAALARAFRENILPLLQEYFYDDYEKIRLVLGDNQKNAGALAPEFVAAIPCVPGELFGEGEDEVSCAEYRYEIRPEAFEDPAAYRFLL